MNNLVNDSNWDSNDMYWSHFCQNPDLNLKIQEFTTLFTFNTSNS